MNEVRIGVKSDASPLHVHGGPAQAGQVAAGDPDIDGFARHVQAVLGDPLRLLPEEQIGCGRAIAGNDMDGHG